MKFNKSPLLIGKFLINNKTLLPLDLEKALMLQKQQGGRIGEVLTANNIIDEKNFYQAIAKQYSLDFCEIENAALNLHLIKDFSCEEYLKYNFIPIGQDNKIIIATCDPKLELINLIKTKYNSFEIVIVEKKLLSKKIENYFANYNDFKARNSLWQIAPLKSALFILNNRQRLSIFLSFILFSAIIFIQPIILLFAINIFYLINNLFKFILYLCGVFNSNTSEKYQLMNDFDLPIYSIIVPVFKEGEVISNIIENLKNINYPRSKLDMKIVIEEDDNETLEAISKIKLDNIFHIIKIPYSLPRTKPKACNYALAFAKGKYVTIYDADDLPHPMQLKFAVSKFEICDKETICLQARLNYFNRNENLLTKFFAIEYGIWFNYLVPGLEKAGMPIPLGGTSNHFIKDKLIEIGGWDPYNVTEDADLGIRMSSLGYKVATLNSLTLEEAPISINSWLKQRARWIKGYLHSFIVHSRSLSELYKAIGFKGIMGFFLFIGSPFITFLITPFMYGGWIALQFVEHETISPIIQELWEFNLIFGSVIITLTALLFIIREKWFNLILPSFIFPLYWLLHSIAAFKALWQLIFKPHYWDKTKHGVSEYYYKNRFL